MTAIIGIYAMDYFNSHNLEYESKFLNVLIANKVSNHMTQLIFLTTTVAT